MGLARIGRVAGASRWPTTTYAQSWVNERRNEDMTQQQKGYLYQSHGAWYVRYRQQVYEPDGSIASVQRSKRLASTREFPKKSEVVQLRNEFMAKLNRVGFTPEAGVSLVDFVENVYFPRIAERLAASTVRGYREA
jgi:hypothetical protein